MSNLNEIVAERIRAIIDSRKLTHSQAADMLAMERSNFTRLQSGDKEITLTTIAKICEVFEVDLSYLFNLPSTTIHNTSENSGALSVQGINTTLVINLPENMVQDLKNQFLK